ncbi:unnamed protein product [Chrysodeixis includens]|uniref:Uncharacterized protein n=1 Tax=Chrysodeixis includens TaxID=689277 RepID=A0A9P0FWI6_CHRIL|nr:unnamed protein product [Chrysodeixis includens]
MWCAYLLVWCVALVPLCACERVLVVFPVARRSHTLLGDHLVNTLYNGGHNVTYITTYTRVKPSERLTVIDIGSDTADAAAESSSLVPEFLWSRLPPHQFLYDGFRAAERALRQPAVQALLLDTATGFDAVVADWYYSSLLAPLGEVFSCPLVWYSGADASWLSVRLVHEAGGGGGAALSVDPLARALPRLPPSAPDRAHRLARQAYLSTWIYYMTNYVESPVYYEVYQLALQRRGLAVPAYELLAHNASLLLINSHPLLGQALPLPNNAKYVAGHHIHGAAGTLAKGLQTIVDKAKHGVIYVNLGGSVSEDLPLAMKQQLLRAFRQLEQTVVWRYRGHLDHVPGNVLLAERVSHQAMLKHSNTVIMITHGGFLPYLEAMYHGVPIIGIPLEEEQLLTMDIVTSRGRGVRVSRSGTMGYHIKDAVIEILGNFSYRSNVQEVSAILHQQLVAPQQELLYWLELAMSTGGAPHLRSPAVLLTAMERFHLDVLALAIMLFWFLTKVAKLVKVYWDDWGATEREQYDDKIKKNE